MIITIVQHIRYTGDKTHRYYKQRISGKLPAASSAYLGVCACAFCVCVVAHHITFRPLLFSLAVRAVSRGANMMHGLLQTTRDCGARSVMKRVHGAKRG